jgi:hypothetical protein
MSEFPKFKIGNRYTNSLGDTYIAAYVERECLVNLKTGSVWSLSPISPFGTIFSETIEWKQVHDSYGPQEQTTGPVSLHITEQLLRQISGLGENPQGAERHSPTEG